MGVPAPILCGSRVRRVGDTYFLETVAVRQLADQSGPFDFGSGRDGSLREVQASLARVIEAVPAAYRDRARCRILSVADSPQIEVSYVREADPDEVGEIERRLPALWDASDAARSVADLDDDTLLRVLIRRRPLAARQFLDEVAAPS